MAKVLKVAPDHLTMSLFDPGMTVLHRAGLGGLVGTLRYIERARDTGEAEEHNLPGGPWSSGAPPWIIDSVSVTLQLGTEETAAAEFFSRLFKIAFDIRDGLVYIPGQYGNLPPSLPVRAALQDGLLRTFYDHGPQSRGLGEALQITCEVDDRQIILQYPRMEWYSHQYEGARLATASLTTAQPLTRMLYPGAIQRHVKHRNSAITNFANLLVPLLFAPVGCFALQAGGRRVKEGGQRKFKPGGAILMPDFDDLEEAPAILAAFIPREVRQTRVVSLGDAALGAEVRLRAANLLADAGVSRVRALWCCATDWNSRLQPPSRIFEIDQRTLSDRRLEQYACAVAALPSRVLINAEGRSSWVDSVIRPLIADNIALGHVWYQNFTRLMTALDHFGRPIRHSLRFEQGGLQEMMNHPSATGDAENVLVCAIHRAVHNNLGRIRQETDGARPLSQATRNRWERFRERLRLSLVGARTADQCRNAICTLFGNAGTLDELRTGWRLLLPMFGDRRWQLTRDLALLALASYSRPEDASGDENPTTEEEN
jgi:CRISPR-associated protein Cas8a1/Csx13